MRLTINEPDAAYIKASGCNEKPPSVTRSNHSDSFNAPCNAALNITMTRIRYYLENSG